MNARAPQITVRPHPFPEGASLPQDWFGGDPYLTHSANGINLVFPDGERFFIRSVMRYARDLGDPELAARVRAFAAQEAQHGKAHEAAFRVLEDQGYEVASWLRWYRWLAYDVLERAAPPMLRLSTTVALEHFTATLATEVLSTGMLDQADPAMQTLLKWHAAEEIEHKSVAFEVFEAVGGSWSMRMAGLAVAGGGLVFFWNSGRRHLMAQDPRMTRSRVRALRRASRAEGHDRGFLLRALRSYLRPGFHPDQEDNRGLAAAWFAGQGG